MSKLQNSSQTVPVYIYPKSLQFFADEIGSHSQKATIFNPFDFPIKFKVLSTAPQKYFVAEPTGLIKSKCCVDLIVRHHSSGFKNENLTDKLRIQIYQINKNNTEISTSNLVGKKDISLYSIFSREEHAHFLNSERNLVNDDATPELSNNNFYSSFSHGNSLNAMMGLNKSPLSNSMTKSRHIDKNFASLNRSTLYPNNDSVSYMVILVGLICLAIMFLPLTNTDTKLPSYFQVTFEIKLFASFVLGIIKHQMLKKINIKLKIK